MGRLLISSVWFGFWVPSRLLIGSVWFGFWVPSVHRLANLGSVRVLTFQTEPCFRVGSGFCQETDLAIYRHHVIISACKFTYVSYIYISTREQSLILSLILSLITYIDTF